MFLPQFDVFCEYIYYWIRPTATWNLFVLYNNEKPFLFQKNFNITRKPAFCRAFARKKKAIWRDLWCIQNEAISLVAMRSKELWLAEKIAPLSNLTRASLLVEWKVTAKTELNREIYKSWRKCWKNQVSFCHRSSPVSRKAWTLPWKLQELKKYPRNLVVAVNVEVEIFVFCGWWFSNQLDTVSETF